VIYASETLPYVGFTPKEEAVFKKHMNLVFSRETLADAHEEIKNDLEQIVQQMSTESDLVARDSLARGRFLRIADVHANKRGDAWHLERSELETPFREDHPVEYWTRKPSSADLITDTRRYPWIPVDIASEDEVPF